MTSTIEKAMAKRNEEKDLVHKDNHRGYNQPPPNARYHSRDDHYQQFLLEDNSGIGIVDIIRTLWFRRGLFASIGLVLATLLVLGNPIVFPDKYEAEASVRVRAIDIDENVRNRTFSVIPTEVLSNRVLQKVVTDLEMTKRDSIPLIEQGLLAIGITPAVNPEDPSGIIRHLRNEVRIDEERVDRGTALFTVRLRDKNPEVATNIVNAIVTTYIDLRHTFDAADSTQAAAFLESRVVAAQREFDTVSDELTEFQIANANFLVPVETIEENISDLQDEYTDSANRAEQLGELDGRLRKLAKEEPRYLFGPAAAAATTRANTELEELRVELTTARTEFNDGHPTIISLQSQIAALEKGIKASGRPVRVNGSTRMSNPEYVQLVTQIETNAAEKVVLERRLPSIAEHIEELTVHLANAKSAQARLLNMQSEWDQAYEDLRTVRSEYNELRTAADAQVGEVGNDLAILDPAEVPTIPVTASRMILMIVGVMGAFAVAFVVVVLVSAIKGWKNDEVAEGGQVSLVRSITLNTLGVLWFVALMGYIVIAPYIGT